MCARQDPTLVHHAHIQVVLEVSAVGLLEVPGSVDEKVGKEAMDVSANGVALCGDTIDADGRHLTGHARLFNVDLLKNNRVDLWIYSVELGSGPQIFARPGACRGAVSMSFFESTGTADSLPAASASSLSLISVSAKDTGSATSVPPFVVVLRFFATGFFADMTPSTMLVLRDEPVSAFHHGNLKKGVLTFPWERAPW